MEVLFHKGELRLLWPFYLEILFFNMLLFAEAFEIVYFIGLEYSLFQIGLIISAMSLAIFIFEIPTGAFADLYGRKYSVILGLFIQGISYLCIFFFTNFFVILVLSALVGFGTTFVSGAREAWITDLVKKDKGILKNYFHKFQSLSMSGILIGGIIGAFVVKTFGIRSIWLVGGFTFFISIIILFLGKEKFVKKNVSIENPISDLYKQSKKAITYSKKHHILYFFIMAGLIMLFSGILADVSWITFMNDLGMPEHMFGYLSSVLALVGILAPFVGNKLLKEGKERIFMIISISFATLFTLLVIVASKFMIAFILLLIVSFCMFIKRPASRIYFHRFIPSNIRASVGSLESMLGGGVAVIGAPIAGLLIDNFGAKITVIISGLVMIFAIIVYLKIND